MTKRPLNRLEEGFLLTLHREIHTTGGLITHLEIDTRKFYTLSGRLEKHGFVESLGYATWGLTGKGREYVTTYLDTALVLPFEDKAVQDFLTLFPEPYQGILRLTLACCVAKRTKLLEAFGSGFPATLLIGEAGIGKSPIGDSLSWLQGKDPSDVKIDARLLTKGEIGGRLERVPGKKQTYRLALSYWQKQTWAQIEEIDKLINRDVSGNIKVIAHAEKFFIREGEKIPNLIVPFMTMNIGGRQRQKALDKIDEKLTIPFVKRNNILFCNPYKGYLGDPSKFFRETLTESPKEKVPVLALNVPISKTELNTSEFDLLAKLIKDGMLPGRDNSHCDKRGVGIEVLAYHALTGNRDVISAIYQIVKDRLQCLESLGLVREAWRDQFNRDWLEYEAVAHPEKAGAIRAAIERQEGLERSIPVIDIAKTEHNGAVDLITEHGKMMDKLTGMRDLLNFPLTSIKVEVKPLPEYYQKELCRRYRKKHEGIQGGVKAEIEVLGKAKTEDNVRIGNQVAKDLWEESVKPIVTDFEKSLERLKSQYIQGLGDTERKRETIRGIEGLIRALWKKDLWATTTNPYKRKAIRKLRETSEPLRNHLNTVLKHKEYSLAKLERELRDARSESHDWFEVFKEDSEDLSSEVLAGSAVWVYEKVHDMATFLKGKGKKRPPEEPPEYNGRPFDGLP